MRSACLAPCNRTHMVCYDIRIRTFLINHIFYIPVELLLLSNSATEKPPNAQTMLMNCCARKNANETSRASEKRNATVWCLDRSKVEKLIFLKLITKNMNWDKTKRTPNEAIEKNNTFYRIMVETHRPKPLTADAVLFLIFFRCRISDLINCCEHEI